VRTALAALKIEDKGAQAFSAAVHSDYVLHVSKPSISGGTPASCVVQADRFFAENAGSPS
jgi:hypothetical protein